MIRYELEATDVQSAAGRLYTFLAHFAYTFSAPSQVIDLFGLHQLQGGLKDLIPTRWVRGHRPWQVFYAGHQRPCDYARSLDPTRRLSRQGPTSARTRIKGRDNDAT